MKMIAGVDEVAEKEEEEAVAVVVVVGDSGVELLAETLLQPSPP